MASNLFCCNRIISALSFKMEIPAASVMAVNINREKIEHIRKHRNISVRTFEKKINLSKSRYYRWVNYETDLSFEMFTSVAKVLGLSNYDILDLLPASLNEQLELLILLIKTSDVNDKEKFGTFLAIKNKLEKYRAAPEHNTFYYLLLMYIDLIYLNSTESEPDFTPIINKIKYYYWDIDYYTTFDIVLYIAVLRFEIDNSKEEMILTGQVQFLINDILKRLKMIKTEVEKGIYLSFLIDLIICLIDIGIEEKALSYLNTILNISKETFRLDAYNEGIFIYLSSFCNEQYAAEIQTNFLEKMKRSSWLLPQEEINILKKLKKNEA